MSHDLEIKNGSASFVSANNQTAWHGLGTVLPDTLLTSEQCIKYARLDYTVDMSPAHIILNGVSVPVPGKFGTYRTDTNTPLGIVGNKYHIVQNTEAFAFFDTIIGESSAIYETAGVLGNGEVIFLTAKMPDYIQINGTDDKTEIYVVLKMSHDGSGAIKAMITPVRVVCQNTLRMAIQGAVNSVNIRHTANAKQKLSEAHKLLDISHKYITKAQALINILANTPVSIQKFDGLVKTLFPSVKDEDSTRIKNIRASVHEAYLTGAGQSDYIGTGWGAYNGVTHYLSHGKSYHNETSKFDAMLEGNSVKIANQALEYLLNNN